MNENQINENINNKIAIIGIGFRIPSGNLTKSISEPLELFNSLLNGFDGIVETSERWSDSYSISNEIACKYAGLLPIDELKLFDPLLFGLSPSEVPTIDPQQRLLLKCVWEAFEDAGINPSTLRGSNASVYVGASSTDYGYTNRNPNETLENIFGSSSHTISNRLSYCFDLHGESLTIDTACSSSLNAVNLGYNSIKYNHSNISICSGVNIILDPAISKSFTQLNMLSPTGKCHSFSSEADGFVRSESIGVVILKRLDEAIKDGNNIYCVIDGSSSNVDGNFDKSSFYSPSKSKQYDNIKLAIKSTNGSVSASDIDYFECHGTGTPTGDPVELEAISMVIKDSNRTQPLLIGSIKSNIGHGEASSGIAALIKCTLMFKYKSFVPNINFEAPNPSIKFNEWNLKVVNEPIKFNENKKTIMAINNFGITGSNCCLLLSEFNMVINFKEDQFIKRKQQYLIPISSNSSLSLDKYKEKLLNLSDSTEFNDFINNQIKFKVSTLCQRSVFMANNWNEFKDPKNEIKSLNSNKISNITIVEKEPIKVFVFCGQGSQYKEMILSLYENEEIFRESFDKVDKELSKYYGYSIIQKLRSIPPDDLVSINEPILAQPLIVMTQISLFELYKHWGVKPDFIVGHSLGEVTSAFCSGMVDFETLCYLTHHRSVAQNKTIGTGRMLSINISPEEYTNSYSSKYPLLKIGCYNSPTSIVIVGKEDSLNELMVELKSKDIFCVMLATLSSFHSSSQLLVKDEMLSLNIQSKQPNIPIFSTVTAKLFNTSMPFNSKYAFDNILNPVLFTQTISSLYEYIESNNLGNDIVFIEIAPHPTLQYYLNQMKSQQSQYFNNGDKISIYSPCNKKKNDYQEFLKTISTLYVNHGININFKSQIQIAKLSKCSLPLYQFDDQVFWKQDIQYEKVFKDGPSIDTLGNSIDSPIVSYKSFIDIKKQSYKWLKGHTVKGKVYFPGCGYIDNLLKIYSNQDISISNIEFKSPFVLVEGKKHCLQTSISPISKNDYQVKYHFKDIKTNQWILSSMGNFSLYENHGNNKEINRININELKDKCSFTKLSKYEIYETIRIKAGLPYKGLFQGVKECYFGNNCSLSIVSLNEIQQLKEFNHLIENKNMNSFFNTAILDTCLHGLLGYIKNQCELVLERIEGFKFYSKNLPIDNKKKSEIYVYSEIKPRINPYSYSGSIKIMLEDGTLLIEMFNVICTTISLSTIQDNLTICPPPVNQIYTPYLQSKNSIFNNPQSFKYLFEINGNGVKEDYNQWISLFYKYINEREPNINLETLSNMDYQYFKQLYFKNQIHENYFKFIFEKLKEFQIETNQTVIPIYEDSPEIDIINKTTKIMSKQLVTLENDDKSNSDTPQSLFENGYLDSFYLNSNILKSINNLLAEIVKELVKPIVFEPIVFRIIEFGCGVGSLSLIILEKIKQLLNDFPNSQIDIEFTLSDISSSFFKKIKENVPQEIPSNINIIYQELNLDKSLFDQQLKPSYYDMVLMSNVLHVVKDIQFSLNEIYNTLSPNGQLIYIEPTYKSPLFDSIYMVFPEWWSFEDKVIRNDRICLKQEDWLEILGKNNFKDIQISNTSNNQSVILIQTKKPSIEELIEKDIQLNHLSNYNNIILYSNDNDNKILLNFKNNKLLKSKVSIISNINDFKIFLNISSIKEEKNLIVFLKSLDQLNENNFKEITLEYIQINQSILDLQNSKNYKQLVLTLNSTKENYLSSSIIGVARYMVEFPKIDFSIIDFDNESIKNSKYSMISLINYLLNLNNGQKEFIIQNNQIFFERFKNQTNIRSSFKSLSFEDNKDQMLIQLDSNLEYKLKIKKKLKANQVEVKVKSTGINYKDYLIYIGLVSQYVDVAYEKEIDSNDGNDSINIGGDFSGIVTNVGSDVKKIKIGDSVCGFSQRSSSSHVVVDEENVYLKPPNISFSQAASIPSIYVTSMHSLYYVGKLKSNETILIHSGTGGVGLSALEILRYKKHRGYIFVTVGSKEKEEYLIDKYGPFITGIYSTRNKDYVENIKNKLKSLGCNSDHQGVDLIYNTLSSDYMDSNFQCLNACGRISDLSITHITPNDYMDYSKFKFNYGYQNIELVAIPSNIIRNHLKKILEKIKSNKLNMIPIIQFSNNNFKDAIQYINERKHIGKIVVDHDQDLLTKAYNDHSSNNGDVIMKESYNISNLNLGKNILLTGQTGIVLEILKWLIKYSNKSIKNIIILSKSPIKWELEFLINQTKYQSNNIIQFYYRQVDIENSIEIENVLNDLEIKSDITNIETIFHFAFINDISRFDQVNINNINQTHGAKIFGAINLHNQSLKRNWSIKQFIMASSVISLVGGSLQCAYVSANCVIDSLSKYRKSIGLPSLSINMGAILSTGFVSRNESINEMFKSGIINLFSPNLIISSLDLFSQNNDKFSNYCLSDFNFQKIPKDFSNPLFLKFCYYINKNRKSENSNEENNILDDVSSKIMNKISELISVEESKLNLDFMLKDYGLDSLIIVQLKNWIDKEFGNHLITIQQLQNNKISISIDTIIKESNKNKNSNKIIENKINYKDSEIDSFIKKEITIEEPIILKPYSLETILKNKHKSIFLTGGTGFLGAYLIFHLVQLDHCSKVYCLVRYKSRSINLQDQLLNNLKKHQLFDKLNKQQISKIIPIQGELSMKRLGIAEFQYSNIIKDCDIIINSAADLDLQSNYETSKVTNVNPLKELIKMSTEGKTQKLLIHFSSVSVFLNHKLNGTEFDELKVLPNFNNTDIGYVQCKVITERLLMDMAKSKGIPSIVIRLPDIWSNPETGIGHENDIFNITLQCSALLNNYPMVFKDFYLTTITTISKNIINIILNEKSWFNNNGNPISIYSLNGDPINMKFIFGCLAKNHQCQEIEYGKWIKLVESSQYDQCKKFNTYHNFKDQIYINNLTIDKGFKMSNRTKQLLKSINSYEESEWEINEQMVINLINYNVKK